MAESSTPIISEEDRKLFLKMRKFGVVEKINTQLLTPTEGMVCVFCGDSKHATDNVNYFQKLLHDCGSKQEPHLVTENGGAIWLPNSTLLEKVPFALDEVMFWRISGSLRLKKYEHVCLNVHAPCGMAGMYGMSVYDVVEFVMAGKTRLKSRIPNIKVYTFLHVCDPMQNQHEPRKTWFINPIKWSEHKVSLKVFDDKPDSPELYLADSQTV